MAFLFDTDAVSEILKRRPMPAYVAWLHTVPRAEQFTSAVVVGELFKGAYRSGDSPRHLRNIEARVLPAMTVDGSPACACVRPSTRRAATEARVVDAAGAETAATPQSFGRRDRCISS